MLDRASYAVAEPWLLLQDPQVRALAFAIGSAPLLRHWPDAGAIPIELPDEIFWQQQLQRYWPRLLQLDTDPRPLQQALRVRVHFRLGYYFEDLLAFWLGDRGWHEFVLLGHGIQHRDGQRTLGELDFVLKNLETGEIEHWEVCLKFYLGEGRLQPAEWVGLQRQDTLGRKLQHLQQRQFALDNALGHRVDRRRAIIKGRLFWPISHQANLTTMAWLNPAHLSGQWQASVPAPAQSWRRATRLEWLVESPQLRQPICQPICQPIYQPGQPTHYWCNGLYLAPHGDTPAQQRLMLRLDTGLIQPPYLLNTSSAQDYSQTRSDASLCQLP